MGPPRKSRSVNRRYTNEASPSKDGDSAKRSNSRKRKLSDMLGHRWATEELTRFYDAYRKYGKDWNKVAGAVRNRSFEMVESLYTMNRAYLSLPHGTASSAGLSAMMTDHYSNLAGSDSDDENNDGAGSSRKPQKRACGKVQTNASKASDSQLVSRPQNASSDYGCLSLLKKKRSGGSRPCPVGKRTPRFPVSFSYENVNGEQYVSPARQGLKLKANADDDEVAHELFIALAKASQIGGSPQVSRTPSKRAESVMSSPFRHAQRKPSQAETTSAKISAGNIDEEDLEGSTEADTDELSRYKPPTMESKSIGTVREKGRNLEVKPFETDNDSDNNLDDIKEECSGTEEGKRFGDMRDKLDLNVTESKISRSSIPSQRKKSKKVLFMRDEAPAFDALQTLADLSLMMPTDNEDDSRLQFKDEDDDRVDESVPIEVIPTNQLKEKRRYSGLKMKGHHQPISTEVASSRTSKPVKGAFDVRSVSEENKHPHQPSTKTRRKQKMQLSKIQKAEGHPDICLSECPGLEAGDAGKKCTTKSRKSSEIGSPILMKNIEKSLSVDLQREVSDPAQSVGVSNQAKLPTKIRSRCKNPPVQNDIKRTDIFSNDQSNLLSASIDDDAPIHEDALSLKEKLSNGLLNPELRKWCTYEWFYSAIDYPWFAKREFVEYLYHVGLGHVPVLTHVEWGVIKSSLGKPRRFSRQFLKEEKEKLNQYRDCVRKHYTELREGVREGLPADFARPLSVGQRVIAIHPETREIHDGRVLTVDHSECRVQFDRPELGVEFVMDIDCMPLNRFENMPALLGRQAIAADKFLENFNDVKINGQAHDIMKLYPSDNADNAGGVSQLSPLTNPASFSKQTKVASNNTNVHARIVSAETASYQQTAYSQAQMQAKEADLQALAELTRALDKKEAIVQELRRMNEDVSENPKAGDNTLKDAEIFKKQYAAVLVQLNEVNDQVASALYFLRQRNTYQGNILPVYPMPGANFADPGSQLSSLDLCASQSRESGSHTNEIIDCSRTTARTMVDAAMKAISSLKGGEETKIEEAVDYVNKQLPSDDSSMRMAPDPKSSNASDTGAQIPSELISKCVATLIMIQKCTERQFPPSDVAKILDSAVTSLQPCSSQNLPVYTEIQKCMGIIRNQIMALIPT